MTFPTPHKVGWKRRILTGLDRYNDRRESFADPVEIPVYAIYPAGVDDQENLKNSEPVDREANVLAPSWPGEPLDKGVLWGKDWIQVGYPEDYNLGPFGWAPGVRVRFKRVEEGKREPGPDTP